MENLSDDEDIIWAWENIKDNIKTSVKGSLGLHELKRHKPRFDEGCLGFTDQSRLNCSGYRIPVEGMYII